MIERRRRLLTLLLAGMALALTVPAGAGAKTFAWSAPASVASGKGNTFVGQLACPSATECTAAGELLGADYDGYVATFNPLATATVTPVKMATVGLEPRFSAVSCPATSQCTAVAGEEWTYDPASASGATSASGYTRFISCPTTTECVAQQAGNYGPGNPDPYPNGVVVFSAFNPQSPAAHTDTVINTGTQNSLPNSVANTLFALACPSTTQCTLVGSNATDGVAYTFDPTLPSSPTATVIDPGLGDVSSAHLACPTATECVLVDRGGQEVTFDPQAPGTPSPVPFDPNPGYTADVSCPSPSQCTAIDAKARAVTFDPASPATTSVTQVADTEDLASIACASTSECVTLGATGMGNLYVGRLVNGTPTGTAAVARPAVKGTAAAVPITCQGVKGLACPVKLSLATKVKGHTQSLGTSARTIAAGHKATVTVRLNHAGLRLLDKAKRLAVTLSIAEKGSRPISRTVTFRKRR